MLSEMLEASGLDAQHHIMIYIFLLLVIKTAQTPDIDHQCVVEKN